MEQFPLLDWDARRDAQISLRRELEQYNYHSPESTLVGKCKRIVRQETGEELIKSLRDMYSYHTYSDIREGYALGHYTARSILPVPTHASGLLIEKRDDIINRTVKLAEQESQQPDVHLANVASQYTLPRLPRENSLDEQLEPQSQVFKQSVQKIAEHLADRSSFFNEAQRREKVNRFMAGFGLAQMATEEVWYIQRKEIADQLHATGLWPEY